MSYQPPPPPSNNMPPGEGPAQPPEGYNPQGGYSPPPPGTGYSQTPPPPPPDYYAPPGPSSYGAPPPRPGGNLFASYFNAITRPIAETYQAEIPNASWGRVFIGLGITFVLSTLILLALSSLLLSQMRDQFDEMVRQGLYTQQLAQDAMNVIGGIFGPVGVTLISLSTFVTFFLGAGVLYLLAKMFGGKGEGFMTHCYLLSLSYTPTRVLNWLLAFIPCLGIITSILLPLYQVYCAGQSMRASQRLEPGKAMLAAFIPAILVILLACGCTILSISLSLGRVAQ